MHLALNKHWIVISGNQRALAKGKQATSSIRPESYERGAEKSSQSCTAVETQSGASRSERVINTRQQENGKPRREITSDH
jgi:hypothetical protein